MIARIRRCFRRTHEGGDPSERLDDAVERLAGAPPPEPPHVPLEFEVGYEVLIQDPPQGPQGTPLTSTWWRITAIRVVSMPWLSAGQRLDVSLLIESLDGARKSGTVYYYVQATRPPGTGGNDGDS